MFRLCVVPLLASVQFNPQVGVRPVASRHSVSRPIVMSDAALYSALGMTDDNVRAGEDWTSALGDLVRGDTDAVGSQQTMAPLKPYVNTLAMSAALAQWKVHPTDCGSTQVQVARLSERIKYLTSHLGTNKKDKATERGLVLLANRRRKLLKYLINEDVAVFEKLSAAYGIRTRKIVEESMGVVRRERSRIAGKMD